MGTWLNDTITAMRELGGICHYSDLYEKIKEIRGTNLPGSWQAIIRRTVEINSSDSAAFAGKDLFYTTKGIGKGCWGLRNYTVTEQNVDLTEDDIEFPEGKKKLRFHILRERNPILVFKAKKQFKERHGALFCEVCKFKFEDKYGSIGLDFIEVHHIKPISELEENERTRIENLVMVCSNCHKMLHRRRPWITKDDLQKLIRNS